MSTCAFDTGFDSGFEICTAVVDDPRTLRGVPSAVPRPRKRPDVAEIRGEGFIAVIGAGSLTGEACLEGWFFVPSAGSGNLVRETFRFLVGQIPTGAEALAAAEYALASVASVAVGMYGAAVGDRLASVVGVIDTDARAVMARDQRIEGRARIAVGGEAVAIAQENDEPLILAAGLMIARRLTSKRRKV